MTPARISEKRTPVEVEINGNHYVGHYRVVNGSVIAYVGTSAFLRRTT